MQRFLIQASHRPEGCRRAYQSMLRAGVHFLTHAAWGCEHGDHAAWLLIDVEDRAAALRVVPPVLRRTAVIVPVQQYSPAAFRSSHEAQAQQQQTMDREAAHV